VSDHCRYPEIERPQYLTINARCEECGEPVRVLVPVEANSKRLCEMLEERLKRAKELLDLKDREVYQLRQIIEDQHKRFEQLARTITDASIVISHDPSADALTNCPGSACPGSESRDSEELA
jgi:hypothetical protein